MYVNAFTGSDVFSFAASLNLRFGRGALAQTPNDLQGLGTRRAFIIADPGVHSADLTAPLLEGLGKAKIDFELMTEIESNPRDTTLHRGADLARQFHADCVVGVGGGSAMDAAKGVALLLTNEGRINGYDGMNKVKVDPPPIIAIPTTAGTGSEVTANAAVTDSATHYKMSIRSPRIIPKLAVVDPSLLRSLPRGPAATSGMDALTHAVEGFLSMRATPVSDFFAREAMRLIWHNIRPFVANPENAEAASGMALGAMLGGIVVSNTGTGNDHALARALGGLCDTPHGLATALFIPHVLRYNAMARPQRFYEIAEAFGLPKDGTARDVAARIADEVHQLLEELGIPTKLSAIGVSRELIPDLVKVALKNVGPNPRRTNAEDLERILEASF